MTPSTPRSISIGAETSPVKAPSWASCMFWAATRTGLWKQCSTAACSEVKDGQTTTSGSDPETRGRISPRNRSVSSVVLCIFQLAARIAVRSGIEQGLQARQVPPLHQLERGAAAGREPIDGIGKLEALQGGHRIAAADHGVPGGRRDRLGDGSGSTPERLELEGPHRPIPEDGPGPGDSLAEIGDRVAPDVESHPALGHVDAVQQTALRVRVELPAEAEVLGQLQDRVAPVGLLEHLPGRLNALLLDERVAGVAALRLEEAEAHRPADQDLLGEAEEAVDHAELVGHLRPAEHDHQRPLGIVANRSEL